MDHLDHVKMLRAEGHGAFTGRFPQQITASLETEVRELACELRHLHTRLAGASTTSRTCSPRRKPDIVVSSGDSMGDDDDDSGGDSKAVDPNDDQMLRAEGHVVLHPMGFSQEADTCLEAFWKLHKPKASVFRPLARMFSRDLMCAMGTATVSTFAKLGNTLLIRAITQIVLDKDLSPEETQRGLLLAAGMFPLALVDSIVSTVSTLQMVGICLGVSDLA
eukprot:TRINITY_DN12931_c0_g1_i3.p2 TRINITY_DN12931_c0_g1~~TRINITY_DN12931_c0_g1_i3.p2  ORF type:complete len:220 (+),score=44.27 TRINITY_DN12931_c0_g1_i3:318-977(+)